MEITKEQLQEWGDNPVTKEIFKSINSAARNECEISKLKLDSVEETALRTAFSQGFVDGVLSFIRNYNNKLEELKGPQKPEENE